MIIDIFYFYSYLIIKVNISSPYQNGEYPFFPPTPSADAGGLLLLLAVRTDLQISRIAVSLFTIRITSKYQYYNDNIRGKPFFFFRALERHIKRTGVYTFCSLDVERKEWPLGWTSNLESDYCYYYYSYYYSAVGGVTYSSFVSLSFYTFLGKTT